MEKLLKFLQSNKAVLLATIMSLATQLWHSVQAFVALEPSAPTWYTYIFGVAFSVSTSFAILLFTVRGRKWLAYFSLAVEVFINVIHYKVLGGMEGPLLYSTLFMCIIVPVYIAMYSSEINPKEKDEDAGERLTGREISQELEKQQPQYFAGADPYLEDGKGVVTVHKKRGDDVKAVTEAKFKDMSIETSQYNGEPNIQVVNQDGTTTKGSLEWTDESKSKVEIKPIGLDDDSFIKEVNKFVGFDITDPTDTSGKVPEETKMELRKLWKQRKNTDADSLKAQMKSILKQTSKPLFNGQ